MAKILLVEDDNNLREIYEARLMAEGYTIATAKDGEEALVVAKKEQPDLIISDVMMPRVSGFEMLDILRNTDGLKDVKVIMLTALGQAEDKTRADSLGADRYLVKSQVTLEDIVKAASDLLSGVPAMPANIATPDPVAVAAPAPTPAAPPAPASVTPAATPTPAPAAPPAVAPAPMPEPMVPPTPSPAVLTPEPPVAPVAPPDTTTLPPTTLAPTTPASVTPAALAAPTTIPEPTAMPAPATNDVVASAVQDLVAGTQQQTSVTQPVSDLPVTPTPEPSTSTTMTAPAPAPAAPDPIAAPVVAPPLATTPIVEPVTVAPAPVVTAPEPASAPEPTVVTPTPAPAPAPESTAASDATDDGVTIPGKKVIKPLATNEQAVQPADLNTLLAKEGISDINGGDAQPTHAPGHVISPMAVDANGQPVDPSSISL